MHLQGCQSELKKFRKNKEKSEELKQLERIQQGLLLDKDILRQLKVKSFYQRKLELIVVGEHPGENKTERKRLSSAIKIYSFDIGTWTEYEELFIQFYKD